MALLSLLVCVFLTLAPTTLAQNVCTQSPYGSLQGLSTYAPAVSYCSKSYPVAKVKTTVTVTAPAETTTLTTMVKREPATKTTVTQVNTVTCTGACSTFGSITASQSVPFISTFCSCIETASTTTVTKTITPKPVKTVTKTKVTTITPSDTPTSSAPAATPTNEVYDPGFELGSNTWGYGGCSRDCSHSHSGSCEALCPPVGNTQGSVAQNLATAAGPSTLSAYVGYIGSSTSTAVPTFTLYINGQNVYQSFICGDGTGVGAGGDCVLDGNAHYKNIQVPYTTTGTNTDIYFAFVFDAGTPDANTLTMLVDDVSFMLN